MKNISLLLASALLLVVSFSACNKDKKKNEETQQQQPEVVAEKVDTLAEKAEVVETPVDTVPVLDDTEIEKIKEDNNLKKDEFYVIGGSFKEAPRAAKLNASLKAKGYEAQVLKPHRGFNRVAIQAYAQEPEARAALAKLRTSFNDVSFWLLVPSK